MEKNYDIEEALRKGCTAEELRKVFEEELKQAQKNIEEDSIEDDDLDEIREDMVDAVIEYMYALGWIDKKAYEDEDFFDSLCDFCVYQEKEFNKSKTKKAKSLKLDADKIIYNFIRSL